MFGVSASTISRDIHHILPILASHLDNIGMPEGWEAQMLPSVCGAVDCSAFRRNRVHPGQYFYYNGQKDFIASTFNVFVASMEISLISILPMEKIMIRACLSILE